jgi:hypothetical protein
MPAKAGTQGNKRRAFGTWTPAFAGATMGSIREASVWFSPLVFSQTHALLANMAGLDPAMLFPSLSLDQGGKVRELYDRVRIR